MHLRNIRKSQYTEGDTLASHKSRFPDRLTAALQARGMNQRELAGLLHINESTVSRWMDEETTPSPGRRRAIEGLLQLPTKWLDQRGSVQADEVPSIATENPDPAGLVWELPEQEAAEQTRRTLRRVDEIVRGHVGAPSLRDMQLDYLKGRFIQCEIAGRAIPAWLQLVYNEVIEGRFK